MIALSASGSVAIVVPQHPAKPFATFHRSIYRSDFSQRIDQTIPNPLVVALVVIVGRELLHCPVQGPFAKEDHLIQAAFLDRSDESLRVGVGLRRRIHPMVPIRRNFFGSRIPSIHYTVASLR